jgi:hypothetical protein
MTEYDILCDCGEWVEIPPPGTPVACTCGATFEQSK